MTRVGGAAPPRGPSGAAAARAADADADGAARVDEERGAAVPGAAARLPTRGVLLRTWIAAGPAPSGLRAAACARRLASEARASELLGVELIGEKDMLGSVLCCAPDGDRGTGTPGRPAAGTLAARGSSVSAARSAPRRTGRLFCSADEPPAPAPARPPRDGASTFCIFSSVGLRGPLLPPAPMQVRTRARCSGFGGSRPAEAEDGKLKPSASRGFVFFGVAFWGEKAQTAEVKLGRGRAADLPIGAAAKDPLFGQFI